MRPQAFLTTTEYGSAAAPATAVVERNPSREFLQIFNPGGTALRFRFGSAPDATYGGIVPPGGAATYDTRVPIGALFVTEGQPVYVLWG